MIDDYNDSDDDDTENLVRCENLWICDIITLHEGDMVSCDLNSHPGANTEVWVFNPVNCRWALREARGESIEGSFHVRNQCAQNKDG